MVGGLLSVEASWLCIVPTPSHIMAQQEQEQGRCTAETREQQAWMKLVVGECWYFGLIAQCCYSGLIAKCEGSAVRGTGARRVLSDDGAQSLLSCDWCRDG